jgi:YHS domain-containing protein
MNLYSAMTAMMRQMGKQILTMVALASAILLAVPTLLPVPAFAGAVVTTIVTDPLSGVAIDGMDPVTYFTEPEPLPGRPDYEYLWSGVPWYFASAANRDVFMRSPEVYAPQFGGHGTMSLARGYLSDGNPRIYMILVSKLYFFYSTGNRDAFQLTEAESIKAAIAYWAILSKQLVAK